jgi:MoaA/NifB/PqqE/SkfB family radical SAM enzyme
MMTFDRVDLNSYVVISIWFGCNNHCTLCMLGEMKRALPAIGLDQFREVLNAIRREGRFQNLILSGAEVTTFQDLDKYVQCAASLGWFKKIQIQTNGRKLSDKAYVRHLIDCGVNEFFVSIHGLEENHNAISRVAGAFGETMRGLKNLQDFDVKVISNTVLTKRNLYDVVSLFGTLAKERISEIHLWNYFPMERIDTKDLVVNLKNLLQLLPELRAVGESAGKALVMKSFPECLSVGKPVFFDNLFPVTVLPDRFWREFDECGFGKCFHRDQGLCKTATCWGLSSAYIHKYGDERELLSPLTAESR